jgi:branched-chain amino acid transport system permease protein
MLMLQVTQVIINGLLLGGIYALISAGLNLIFGVIKIVNLAHGDFMMLGMYATFWFFSLYGISPFVSIPIVAITLFLIGLLAYKGIIKPLSGRAETEINTILATAGLGLVLQNVALLLWKSDYRAIQTASSGQSYRVFNIMISTGRLWAFLVVVIVAIIMYYILMKTRIGLHIRAVSQDPQAALLMGINTDKIFTLSFSSGIALVGIAAAIITPIFYVFPTVGSHFNTMAFIIVVLGGLGSFIGALVGGLIIGIVESAAGLIISAELAQVVSLSLFILVLFFRPEGLMGKNARV